MLHSILPHLPKKMKGRYTESDEKWRQENTRHHQILDIIKNTVYNSFLTFHSRIQNRDYHREYWKLTLRRWIGYEKLHTTLVGNFIRICSHNGSFLHSSFKRINTHEYVRDSPVADKNPAQKVAPPPGILWFILLK